MSVKYMCRLFVCVLAVVAPAYAFGQTSNVRARNRAAQTQSSQQKLNAALLSAVQESNADAVVSLLKRGANPNSVSNGSPALVLAITPNNLEKTLTPAKENDIAVVEALLNAGALPDAADANGATALAQAVARQSVPLCELLVTHHAHIDLPDKKGLTPLMRAVVLGDKGTVEFLLKSKANPNARNPDGITPLGFLLAARGKQVSIVDIMYPDIFRSLLDLLLKYGADIKAKLTDGMGILSFAAIGGNVECASVLIEKGADVNEKSDKGMTPLFSAVEACKAPMVRMLLEKGADPNRTGPEGVTPLMVAALRGSYGITNLLLAKGAATDTKASDGTTALKVARDEHITALVNLLTAAGAKD